MRTRWWSPLALAAALAACGNLDNAPLGEGAVQGRLLGTRTGMAQVLGFGDLGNVALREVPDTQGRFTLEHVPPGDHELYLQASPDLAQRKVVAVQPGRTAQLEDLQLEATGTLVVELGTPGQQSPARGVVLLPELHPTGFPVTERGGGDGEDDHGEHGAPGFGGGVSVPDGSDRTVTLRLAGGCYSVQATLDGFADTAVSSVCVTPRETRTVTLQFPVPDMTDNRDGCERSGCLGNLACNRNTGACG